MFKLILVTIVALIVALMIFGNGAGRAVKSSATPQPSAEAQPAPQAAVPEIVVEQTPLSVPEFSGPALRPSPEHRDNEVVAATPGAATAAVGTEMFVTASAVNFRAGPSTSDPVVASLRRGAVVTAVGAPSGDWMQIRDADGRVGFISGQFLSSERP